MFRKMKIEHQFSIFIFQFLKNENWTQIFIFHFFNFQKKWMTLIYTHSNGVTVGDRHTEFYNGGQK